MKRFFWISMFLTAVAISLILLGCGPHRKSVDPPIGSPLSPWVQGPSYWSFEFYFHKSLTDKQQQCFSAAFKAHHQAWQASNRGLFMVGAPRWGKVWFHGIGAKEHGPTNLYEKMWALPGRPGAIHIIPGIDHRLPGLTACIDKQQDPNLDAQPGPAQMMAGIEAQALRDAFSVQQFLGCH